MTKYQSNSALKNDAKVRLDGFYGLAITAWLLVQCIFYITSMLADMLAPGNDTTSSVLYLLLSLLASVFSGAFHVGLAYFYLSLSCGKPCHSLVIFHSFKEQPEKALKISLIQALASFLCTTPATYFLLALMREKSLTALFQWLIVLGIGYAVYIPISLFLSQSWYLLADFPHYTAKDALLTGCSLMKKHFFRLLFLKISFLPLTILCIFSFGIGFIWLIPYKEMTYTCFYLDIMKPKQS